MPQDDPTNRAGEHTDPPAVPVVAPEQEAPKVAPVSGAADTEAVAAVVGDHRGRDLGARSGVAADSRWFVVVVTPTPSDSNGDGHRYVPDDVGPRCEARVRLARRIRIRSGRHPDGDNHGPCTTSTWWSHRYTVTGTVSGSNAAPNLGADRTSGGLHAQRHLRVGTITATFDWGALRLQRGTLAASTVFS